METMLTQPCDCLLCFPTVEVIETHKAKRIVSTDSGTAKSQKTFSFWHSTAGFPQKVASNMTKSPKTTSFDVFWRFSLIFPLSKKRPYKAKQIVSTIFWGHFRAHQKRKKPLVFDTRPLFFPERCTGHTKTCKKIPVFNTRQPDSRRGLLQKLKNRKNSTRTFPERGCTGHVFRDYWVALK